MRAAALLLLTLFLQEDAALKGSEKTQHFTIRFRPGSRAAAAVDRIMVMAERDFDRITKALDIKPEGGLELHLYDDLAEIASVTGVKGTGGFSSGNTSHIPYDNDQTRFHEMVHIIAYRLPKAGPSRGICSTRKAWPTRSSSSCTKSTSTRSRRSS